MVKIDYQVLLRAIYSWRIILFKSPFSLEREKVGMRAIIKRL
jgi:hypothetical protein